MADYILTLHCENRPGIVAAVATRLAAGGGDITEAQQFDDALTGRFFMRVAFAMERPVAAIRSARRSRSMASCSNSARTSPRFDSRPSRLCTSNSNTHRP